MSLLEPEEENAGDVTFDPDSKVRLFETQQRSSASVHSYVIKFLPVALIAILIIAGVIWFMQPGIGDAVRPPKDVADAVDEYMLSKEHRSIREITFYKCSDYYWVRILAEPRSALGSVDDPSNQYRLRVERNGDAAASIQTLPLPDKQNDVPCKE
jgi:hypothetical protein